MKKLLLLLTATLLLCSSVVAQFAGGVGTKADPYQVATAEQLNSVRNYRTNHFVQTADIDLVDYPNWEPICNSSSKFTGSFDGGGYTISNLTYSNSSGYHIGLFGYFQPATSGDYIRNVNLNNVSINTGGSTIGAVVGYCYYATIHNCSMNGNISGENMIGGIVGNASYMVTISNCYADVSINSIYGSNGGIAGGMGYDNCSMSQCFAKGVIYGSGQYNGGLVGSFGLGGAGYIENSYSAVDVIGDLNSSGSGGIAGSIVNSSKTIKNCFSTGLVQGGNSVGGITGYINNGIVKNSFSTNSRINNTIINQWVSTGRICPNDFASTLSNNYAWEEMYVNSDKITDGTLNSINGENITLADIQDINFYTNTDNWYEGGVWNFTDIWELNHSISPYPILKAIPAAFQNIKHSQGIFWVIPFAHGINQTIEAPVLGGLNAITYQSSNPAVIEVVGNTLVTHSAGTADITATIAESEFYAANSITQTFTVYQNGTGTKEDPFLISTVEQLNSIRNNLTMHYRLANDLDLGVAPWNVGEGWQPIAQYDPYNFSGSFDGAGFTISNLTINRPDESMVGLFGKYCPATPGDSIKNLTLQNVSIIGNSYTGALAGEANQAQIYNCHSSGSVSGPYFVGGVVGVLDYYGWGKSGTPINFGITYSSSSCSVVNNTTNNYTGGIVGYIEGEYDTKKEDKDAPKTRGAKAEPYENAILAHCNFTGTVNGGDRSGGVAGYATFSTISDCQSNITLNSTGSFNGGVIGYAYYCDITNCHSEGSVTGSGYSGGVIGYLENSSISYSTSSVNVDVGSYSDAGGIAAYAMSSNISHCTATGSVTGYNEIGGIVGNGDGNIENCSSSGVISGVTLVGGITGAIGGGNINGCTFTGEVFGEDTKIGGIVGMMYSASVSNSTSSGIAIGENNVGGIAGSSENSTITSCTSSAEITGNSYIGGIVGNFYAGTDLEVFTINDCSFSGSISGTHRVGGIIGSSSISMKTTAVFEITNCHNTGSVTGTNSMIGGIAGKTGFTNITGCTNTGSIDGKTAHLIGGIVGFFQNGIIDDCESSGDISGSNFIGGITGGFDLGPFKNESKDESDKSIIYGISNCTSSSNINALTDDVGGIAGGISNGFIRNSGSTGIIDTQNGNNIGGIAGTSVNASLIEKCFSLSQITGKSYVGGIAGYLSSGQIANSYSTGKVESKTSNRVGGVVGYTLSGATIVSCYATGIVSSINQSGGIAGDMISSTIKNSIALNAKVLSNGGAGRLICDNDGANTYINNYGWDGLYVNNETETGGVLNNEYGLDATITQLTSEEFYTTPANWDTEEWDFTNTWTIDPEVSPYPVLKNLDLVTQTIQHAQVITWPQVLSGSIDDEIELTAAGGVNAITYTSSNPDVASIAGNIMTVHQAGSADITATIAGSEFYTPATMTRIVVIYNGDGTPENPYEISTLEQLDGVRNNLAAHYKLVADIDMSPFENWEPIGTQGTPFTGSFDGNEHILSNLNIHGREQLTGLFGCFIPESEEHNYIKDLTLANVNLSAESHIGALAVETEGGVIQGCNVSGVIKGNGGDYIGGLVGTSLETQFNQCISSVSIDAYSNVRVGGIVAYEDGDGTISYCSFTGSISGDWNTNNLGGIVGETYGSISNCSNTGRIKGAYNVGGIVGYSVGTNTIDGCHNSGNVTGNTIVGGIVGYAQGIIITGCSSSGSITATEMEAGGIAGFSTLSSISLCYNSGKVTSPNDTGGIIGDAQESEIDQCFNTGDVITNSYAGGIIGNIYESTIITNCYSTGEIKASNNNAGGVCGGASESEVSTSYATGKILTQISHGGGIVANVNSSAIKNNFAANALIEDNGDLDRISAETAASTLSNNYAWDDMYVGGVKIIDGTLTDNNGQNAPYAQLSSEAFYTTGGNWDTQPWDFTDVWIMDAEISPYPVLKAMDMDAQKVKHQQGILWDQDITGLNIEDEVPLTAVGGATGSIIYYSSSDPAVASVTEGVLTVHAAGGTMITAWVDGNEFFRPDSVMKSLVIWESDGTESDPHEIWNLAQLDAVRLDLNAHYVLMADIDMSPFTNWEPIGNYSNPFTGSFNGNENILSHLTINKPYQSDLGLFGGTENAHIENLSMIHASIYGHENIGVIVGYAKNSTITHCHTSGAMQGSGYEVGGIVGFADGSNISLSSSSCNISDFEGDVGGIVGFLNNSTIENSWFTGSIFDIDNSAGGIVGYPQNSFVSGCFNAGSISGRLGIGGIVGQDSESEIVNCYNTGNIYGSISDVGGIGGNGNSNVYNSYNSGVVNSNGYWVGGIYGSYYQATAKNNVSIAAKVISNGEETNRLYGYNFTNTLANNYAWADMYVNDSKVTTGTLTNENGQNASLAQLKSEAFYTTGSNWDGSAWDFIDTWVMNQDVSPYPILINIPTEVQRVKHEQVMTNAWTQTLPTDATYGDVIPLTAPSEGPSEEIEYTSSNPAVAEIVGNQLTAVGLGTATITVRYPETEFYSESNGFSKTFTVTNKASQTIEWSQTLSATYGDADIALTATATSGLEVVYESDDLSVATIDGSTLTIVGAGTATITASQAGNDNYNAAPNVELTLTVDQLTLTLSNFTADDKEYDGTTTVTGTGFDDSRLTGDLLEFTFTAAFADKNVGAGKTVNYSDIAISGGADAGNYTLAYNTGITTADITVLGLTIGGTFTAQDKEYDGTSIATIDENNLVLLTPIEDDDVELINVVAEFADAEVEDGKVVSITAAMLDGADKDNYSLTLVGSPTATASITEPVTPQYALTLMIVGSGSVEVNGVLYVDIMLFDDGSEVELLAIPSEGYQFEGWSGDITSSEAFENITMSSDKVITATFSQIPEVEYSLTIQVVGSGTVEVQGSVYTEVIYIVEGSIVELEAIATTGWQFDDWTGDLASTNAIESITMNGDKAITATFSEIVTTQYTLTITIVGSGTVEVEGEIYTVPITVDEGTVLDLEAIAAEGWQFDGWTGEVAEALEATTTITMNGDKAITATFSEIVTTQYTLTITIIGSGTVEVDGEVYTVPITVDEGTVLDLEAIAAEGWQFDGWTGEVAEALEATTTITMDADKAVTATFSIIDNVETGVFTNLKVFPNPFRNFIALENAQGVSRMVITNLIGQKVMETQLSGAERETIQTDGLTNGIYLMVFEAENGERVIRRMVKE